MLEMAADLETQLARLKEQLAGSKREVSADDVDRLKDIRDDLQVVIGDR